MIWKTAEFRITNMLVILWILEIIVGILLVLAVLMQVTREGVLGSMFGGGAQSIFGPKGPTTLLEKLTFGLIGLFFLITIAITKISVPSTSAPERLPEVPSPEDILPPENVTSPEVLKLPQEQQTPTSYQPSAFPPTPTQSTPTQDMPAP